MPELPEVETVRNGITPHLSGHRIDKIVVRESRLRWPVPADLAKHLVGQSVERVERRAKYLLIYLPKGVLIVHLGMSGRLYFVAPGTALGKHDHIDWILDNGQIMRYTDPRRFGAVLWAGLDELEQHPLLQHLGPEPLFDAFSGEYLYEKSRGRKLPIKSLLMDGRIVVGVGNIYANEALFMAGIRPSLAAGKLSKPRCTLLVEKVKRVLQQAIAQGGTTLKDFVNGDGKPGYFKQELLVYGRANQPCVNCSAPLKETRLAQRTTVYCSHCQK